MAKLLVVIGLIMTGVGLLLMAGVPLGRLPGDLVIRRGHMTFYFPIVTSLLVSLVLTVLLSLFRR